MNYSFTSKKKKNFMLKLIDLPEVKVEKFLVFSLVFQEYYLVFHQIPIEYYENTKYSFL